MRRLAIAILVICCASVFGQKWSGSGPHQPATEAYLSRVGTIIFNAIGPECAKHPERLRGTIKVSLRLDSKGDVRDLKVLSATSDRWVQDTVVGVVRSIKLPPMPKEVAAEQGHDWVNFKAQWDFQFHPFGSNHLRFDGFYCCERDTSIGPATFYLRFYPDGVVLSVISTGTPLEVAKWFNRQKQQNFRYSVIDGSLRFREETDAMIFDYSGIIDEDSLSLRVDGYDRPTKASMGSVRRSYKFVQVPSSS